MGSFRICVRHPFPTDRSPEIRIILILDREVAFVTPLRIVARDLTTTAGKFLGSQKLAGHG